MFVIEIGDDPVAKGERVLELYALVEQLIRERLCSGRYEIDNPYAWSPVALIEGPIYDDGEIVDYASRTVLNCSVRGINFAPYESDTGYGGGFTDYEVEIG